MIWHNGRLYTYDGPTVGKDWSTPSGLRRCKPMSGGRYDYGYPGYVRLVEVGTGEVLNVRTDLVMLTETAV